MESTAGGTPNPAPENAPASTQGKVSERSAPGDSAMTTEELKTKLGDKGTLKAYPVTPAAHLYLRDMGVERHPMLRNALVSQAETEARQLDLERTKEAYNRFFDTPMTADEIAEKLKDRNGTIETHPMTMAANSWLWSQRLNPETHERLKKWIVTEAKKAGQQLNVDGTKAVHRRFFSVQAEDKEKYIQLVDRRVDDSAGEVGEEGPLKQVDCYLCDTNFRPMRKFKVSGGQREVDPKTKKEIVLGNYQVFYLNPVTGEPDPESTSSVPTKVGICDRCLQNQGIPEDPLTCADAEAKVQDIQSAIEARSKLKEAERIRMDRAEKLKKSLVGRDGQPVVNTGNALRDIDKTAQSLDRRRQQNRR